MEVTTAGQPGQPAGGRRQMSTAVAILLMTVGAILLFALTAGSPHWVNLQIVGAIFIIAGVLGLAIPRLARSRGSRLRRRSLAPMSAERHQPQSGDYTGRVRRSDLNGNGRTLTDDILGVEHDPLA